MPPSDVNDMNKTTLVLFAIAALAVVATPAASARIVDDLKENAFDLIDFVANPYYPNCYSLPVEIEDPTPATHIENAGHFCWAP